ncbi:hypothetical protein T11_8727 [Trichinella zimbabwensis]|uniref:Uncharacterized protein n=1 Tax=Trichinella zimbabwensis TaxID=268475 RepID=A0A0V1GEK3_9BILA|nr:hypothetical protein T11_8727 [Trichinella zimbabwensis]
MSKTLIVIGYVKLEDNKSEEEEEEELNIGGDGEMMIILLNGCF